MASKHVSAEAASALGGCCCVGTTVWIYLARSGPETVCYLDYNPGRAGTAEPDRTQRVAAAA
jgi:hypothetical protein